jgi:hypothetical protein
MIVNCTLYQIRLGKYIIVKARQEAGGRGQEEDHYSIKTGSGINKVLLGFVLKVWRVVLPKLN